MYRGTAREGVGERTHKNKAGHLSFRSPGFRRILNWGCFLACSSHTLSEWGAGLWPPPSPHGHLAVSTIIKQGTPEKLYTHLPPPGPELPVL